MRTGIRLSFLLLLVCLQAAQGMLAGAALCLEETGEVALEWAKDGQCEKPGAVPTPCVHEGEASTEHCGPCFDIPLPSETSLKSVTLTQEWSPALVSSPLVLSLAASPEALSAPLRPVGSLLPEQLRSVRLLI
jgi:hypothetical protein